MRTNDAAGLEDAGAGATTRKSRGEQLPWITFAVYLAIAFFVLLHFGRHFWFYQDEWTLLLRNLSTPSGLLRPLNQHWVTLPLIVFHVLFWLFGLNYGPYQICTIALHLTLVALLRLVMRRAGVGPWLATVAAGSFVLFGPGQFNILQSVQMSLVGSVVLGLISLLCADHDGSFTRRDAVGLAFGALGLMTSNVGTIMVIIVGLAVLFRRGWRMAALLTAPLAALDGAWYLTERSSHDVPMSNNPIKYAFHWITTGERAVFVGLGNYRVVAIALAVLLVVGLVIAWRPLDLAELRQRASAPAALLLGVPIMLTIVSTQRYLLNEPNSSKFIHIGAAFTLPALAVAAQAVARRFRRLMPAVCVLLLIGVPGNIGKFTSDGIFPAGTFMHEKQMLLGAAYSPDAKLISRGLSPYNELYGATGVTMGYLLDARAAGRLPPRPFLGPMRLNELAIRTGVGQLIYPPAGLTCRQHAGLLVLHPTVGSVYVFNTPMTIRTRNLTGKPYWATVVFNPFAPPYFVFQTQLPHLALYLTPFYPPTRYFRYCT